MKIYVLFTCTISLLYLSYIYYKYNYCLLFTGCSGYTVYCEVGNEVCLDFGKDNSLDTFAIKRGSSIVCASTDGVSTYVFQPYKVNCSISTTKMSMCLGNFLPEDAGTISLHNGLTSTSILLSSISLAKASK